MDEMEDENSTIQGFSRLLPSASLLLLACCFTFMKIVVQRLFSYWWDQMGHPKKLEAIKVIHPRQMSFASITCRCWVREKHTQRSSCWIAASLKRVSIIKWHFSQFVVVVHAVDGSWKLTANCQKCWTWKFILFFPFTGFSQLKTSFGSGNGLPGKFSCCS